MSEDALNKIVSILHSDNFKVEGEITESSEIKNFNAWDSLKHLMFLIEIEKEFDIEISPEEVNQIVYIKDLIMKIEK